MADQSFKENVSEIVTIVRSYVNARIELWKLTLLEKTSLAGALFLSSVIIVIIIAFCLLFLSLAFTYWYAEKTGDFATGFLIAAGFYVIVGIIFILFRKYLITRTVIKSISSILFAEDESEEQADDEKKEF